MFLPFECIEGIVVWCRPQQRYKLATDLRMLLLQKQTKIPLAIKTYGSLNCMSARGLIEVLEYWETTTNVIKYFSCNAWVAASRHGHVSILEWWKRSGFIYKHSDDDCIDVQGGGAHSEGRITRLHGGGNVYISCQSTPSCYETAILDACRYGHVKVLEWWKTSDIIAQYYSYQAMDEASKYGHTDVLEWWKTSGFRLHYTCEAMDAASLAGHVSVLEWWKQSGLELKFSQKVFTARHASVVAWWKRYLSSVVEKLESLL